MLLTACGAAVEANAEALPKQDVSMSYVAVDEIVTDEPVISIKVDDVWTLKYTILPYNATDKEVSIEQSVANNLFTVSKFNDSVIVTGKNVGTGVLSLVASNGKFVSYSITVTPPSPPPVEEPVIYDAKAVAEYFNFQAAGYGIRIKYDSEFKGYLLEYDFGVSTDDSLENLKQAAYFFWPFFPKYMMSLGKPYYVYATPTSPAEVDIVLVNSNHSTCAIIYSMIESEHLVATVLIYNNYED